MRKEFLGGVALIAILTVWLVSIWPPFIWSLVITGPLMLMGFRDFFQTRKAVLRNFPLIGHFRYWLEMIRPEIQQYFIESNSDGVPFSRETRSVVYQRAKKALQTLPFGTQKDVYETGYAWVNHSLAPLELDHKDLRVTVGGPACKQPYSASLFNISAMSYGALSASAIQSLNLGAKLGKFAHNTGEGSISSHHLQGGDLIWQIGTGYFGCRTQDGEFDPELFKKNAARPEVKMIEIKLSQGAKPGHGGILPAAKITPEIAKIRNVPMGKDVLSPPAHKTFSTPKGLLEFVQQLRELSEGKPVGFKLCVGRRREFLAICKAMLESKILPDFIVVDGGEGGTGAAPLEFANSLGTPLTDGLVFVHNSLVGIGVRKDIKIIAAGKIAHGINLIGKIALGADLCYGARSMMLALGCIQALKCNSNHCPVGVATQNPDLERGLVVSDKSIRVKNYHEETIESVSEILGSMGLQSPDELRPWHLQRRTGPYEVKHYGDLFEYIEEGSLLSEDKLPESFARAWKSCSADSFRHTEELKSSVWS